MRAVRRGHSASSGLVLLALTDHDFAWPEFNHIELTFSVLAYFDDFCECMNLYEPSAVMSLLLHGFHIMVHIGELVSYVP